MGMRQGWRVERVGSIHVVRCKKKMYLNCAFNSTQLYCMDQNTRDLRDVNDKLDSLHRRVDKFYEWAAILQKEFRDMQQRQRFIESNCPMDFPLDSLQNRLESITGRRNP